MTLNSRIEESLQSKSIEFSLYRVLNVELIEWHLRIEKNYSNLKFSIRIWTHSNLINFSSDESLGLSIHRIPPPMSFLLRCDRGQKTKPKIILAKFYPSLSLGRIRFQRFA